MIHGLLNPGYVRFDGSKFVTDDTINLVGPAGPPGPQGISGINGANGASGQNAFTTLISSFIQPIAGSGHPINISVVSSAPFTTGQTLFIQSGGYYYVNSVSPGSLNIYNIGSTDNVALGSTIPATSLVTAAGAIGVSGINSYTTLTTSFTQPAINGAVSVSVVESRWAATGQTIYINNGGYYTISSIPTNTSIIIINLGYSTNISPGAIAGGIGNAVSPAGPAGATGATGATGSSGNVIPVFSPLVAGTQNTTLATASGNVTTATRFYVTTSGLFCSGVRFYWKNFGSAATIKAGLWFEDTTSLVTSINVSASADNIYTATFGSPVALTPFHYYHASIYHVAGTNYTWFSRSTGQSVLLPTSLIIAGNGLAWINFNQWQNGDAFPSSQASSENYPVEPIISGVL